MSVLLHIAFRSVLDWVDVICRIGTPKYLSHFDISRLAHITCRVG